MAAANCEKKFHVVEDLECDGEAYHMHLPVIVNTKALKENEELLLYSHQAKVTKIQAETLKRAQDAQAKKAKKQKRH